MTRRTEAQQRAAARKRLAEIRATLKQLAKAKRDALRQISRECREARKLVRPRVKAWGQHQAELVKAAEYGVRARLRDECEARKGTARKNAATAVDAARSALAIEAEHVRELKRSRRPTNPKRRAGGLRSAEKRAESLEEIANNLPDDLRPVFERNRGSAGIVRAIKKGESNASRLSPTEAVLEYLQEHPDLVWEAQRSHEAVTDADLQAEREHWENWIAKPAPKTKTPQMRAAFAALFGPRGVFDRNRRPVLEAMIAAGDYGGLQAYRDERAEAGIPFDKRHRAAWDTLIGKARELADWQGATFDPVPF